MSDIDDTPPTAGPVEDADDEPVFSSLPEFSDDEAPVVPKAPVASSSRAPSKGVPGRKKMPLAQLKKKLGGGGDAVKKVKADEPLKGIKLSDAQMDEVMRQLVLEEGPDAAKLDRKDVQNLIDQVGLNKDVLQGKQGLMGKGTKEAGSVVCSGQEHQQAANFESSTQLAQVLVNSAGAKARHACVVSVLVRARAVLTRNFAAEDEIREGPLEANKPMEMIRQEPYDLSSEFRWVSLDLSNPKEVRDPHSDFAATADALLGDS